MSEHQIEQWRKHVQRRATLTNDDVAELEEHLRGQVDDLIASGLTEDEAFLVAVKRMGSVDELSREFAIEHSERLWKQLVLTADDPGESRARGRDLWLAICLGVGAALSLRAGLAWLDEDVFVRLVSVLVLPWVVAYFAWKRDVSARTVVSVAAGYAAVAALLVAYPFHDEQSDTLLLAVIHTPILLWLLMGVVYVGGDWRSGRRRMDFIRFTGEWAVYYFLLAAGGGLLLALAGATFNAVNIDAAVFLFEWVLPMGAAGAAVIAAWLVESKQNVIENIAPVLARVFSPLTVLLLVALLIAFAANPDVIDVERELLILMTVILVLVLALWLYAVSARPPQAPAGLADWLQVVLVVTAILVDLVVLIAMASRIAELGLTPNRAAALGLNILLLVNLAVSAWLGLAFVRGRRPVAALERWQTDYLPVYAAWAAVVVVLWGPLFDWA
ncbi:MAG TPA: permease prefix domain 1-containing protein [Nocardioides sp.]|uniref:permease prefix domain 1-containing protein n=1 Tax=Nocardioides sp. TaxID=35761 RepID=UPI002C130E91|nr:permease prefix domain 1-containing protein [Nocardioides sp.]HQR25431.1 permease prefix domain 1-containing protein [Nocardioides sp.]